MASTLSDYEYPEAPTVSSTQPQYTPSTMGQMAQDYWQQQTQTPIYSAEQQAALENRMRNQLNTQLGAAQEDLARVYGQGGQSGAQTQAMRDLYLQGLAGQQNILSDVGLQLAQAEANRNLQLANLGQGLAGTLGNLNLAEWQQTQYNPYQDAMSQNIYYAQLAQEEEWKKKLAELMGQSYGGNGWNTGAVRSTYVG